MEKTNLKGPSPIHDSQGVEVGREMTTKWHKEKFGVIDMFYILTEVVIIQLYTFVEIHRTAYPKT